MDHFIVMNTAIHWYCETANGNHRPNVRGFRPPHKKTIHTTYLSEQVKIHSTRLCRVLIVYSHCPSNANYTLPGCVDWVLRNLLFLYAG